MSDERDPSRDLWETHAQWWIDGFTAGADAEYEEQILPMAEHELAGGRVAGQHPALCTPVAELRDHPQGTPGLLLPLIPPGHVHLSGPPSMESCTRDVYAEGWRIGAPQALRLARTIAGAVAHLHQRGVVHGDLYAHNILWNPERGGAMLSDFGAATLLPIGLPALRRALQLLEVRAFGCLLE